MPNQFNTQRPHITCNQCEFRGDELVQIQLRPEPQIDLSLPGRLAMAAEILHDGLAVRCSYPVRRVSRVDLGASHTTGG